MKQTNQLKLTPHFSLGEFTQSYTAELLGIENVPNQEHIRNLQNLCQKVLEPIREHLGKPVHISSGFRCPELNHAVGGVMTSQHQYGEAADILVKDFLEAADLVEWIMDNLSFDQLLMERNRNRSSYWVHVSCKLHESDNRNIYTGLKIKG